MLQHLDLELRYAQQQIERDRQRSTAMPRGERPERRRFHWRGTATAHRGCTSSTC
jgi:hypothetical protein